MARIVLEMEKCYKCPFCDCKRTPTSDSFEDAHDYSCKAAHGRVIANYVEWNREMPTVPAWCPHLLKVGEAAV